MKDIFRIVERCWYPAKYYRDFMFAVNCSLIGIQDHACLKCGEIISETLQEEHYVPGVTHRIGPYCLNCATEFRLRMSSIANLFFATLALREADKLLKEELEEMWSD